MNGLDVDWDEVKRGVEECLAGGSGCPYESVDDFMDDLESMLGQLPDWARDMIESCAREHAQESG